MFSPTEVDRFDQGTTSVPKGNKFGRSLPSIHPLCSGALLTHGNLAMAAQSNLYGYSIGSEERVILLSYLPLAHIYEVCWQSIVHAHFPQASVVASQSDGCHCPWRCYRLFHRRSSSTARGCTDPQAQLLPLRAASFESHIPGCHDRWECPWLERRYIPACRTDKARKFTCNGGYHTSFMG
jgi:hypothetical protein